MSELRHVYILGAGFSMPLGGPSFNQLISNLEQKAVADIVGDSTYYSHVFLRGMPDIVNRLWSRIGRAGDLNLEELLETIDYAAQNSQFVLAGEIIEEMNLRSGIDRAWSSRRIEEISRLLRLRLAISTTTFPERIPDDSERWLPYKEWFRDLTPMDTVITFNYDTVVEKAAALTNRPYFPSSLQSVWNPTYLTAPKEPLPILLKLHGSADWFSDGDTSKSTLENVHAYRMKWTAYFEDNVNILIGTPGLAKSSLSEGLFKPMWEQAAKAIREAHVVSLVGYSIPATDNLAKALIENNLAAATNLLAVNVVLGPSANSPIAKRAVEILSQARRCNGHPFPAM